MGSLPATSAGARLRRAPPFLDSEPVSADRVACVPECAECGARWLPGDEERWWLIRVDLYGFAPPTFYDLAWFCRTCAVREFGDGKS